MNRVDVLAVIANDDVREEVVDLLERIDYEVREEPRALAAMDRMGASPPDLVILDVRIDSPAPREVREAIRELHPEVRVLLLDSSPGHPVPEGLDADLVLSWPAPPLDVIRWIHAEFLDLPRESVRTRTRPEVG